MIRNYWRKNKTIAFYILLIVFSASHFSAYGETTMMPVHSLNRALMPKLEPKIYSTKKKKIEGIFSVPVDNAIATNRLGNAITLISFKDDKIKYKTIKRNFLDYVSSGKDGYMPIFSEDTIGYSIRRGFLLFNIKNNKFNYYSIAGGFNYKIYQIGVIDPDKKIFLFKICDISDKTPTFLRLMDLSKEEDEIIAEKDVGNCGITVKDKLIFVWNKNSMYVMNSKFEEVEHPLVTIFNREKRKDYGRTLEFIIHPNLPLAIIQEEKKGETYRDTKIALWAITWRESDMQSDRPKMIKVLSEDGYFYKFSYDGNWLCFVDASTSPRGRILMPVDPDLPHFIGKPIYLGDVPRSPYFNGSAMTRNPSGVIVSQCEGYDGKCWLTKWDFTEAEKLIEKNR